MSRYRYTMSNIKARSRTELRAFFQYRYLFLDVKIAAIQTASLSAGKFLELRAATMSSSSRNADTADPRLGGGY